MVLQHEARRITGDIESLFVIPHIGIHFRMIGIGQFTDSIIDGIERNHALFRENRDGCHRHFCRAKFKRYSNGIINKSSKGKNLLSSRLRKENRIRASRAYVHLHLAIRCLAEPPDRPFEKPRIKENSLSFCYKLRLRKCRKNRLASVCPAQFHKLRRFTINEINAIGNINTMHHRINTNWIQIICRNRRKKRRKS